MVCCVHVPCLLLVIAELYSNHDDDDYEDDRVQKYKDTAWIEAVINKQLEIADVLIDEGAIVNAVVTDCTALVSASSSHEIDVVNKLCRKGADVNKSTTERSPLMAAASAGDLAAVEALMDAGAYVNAVFG